MASIEVHDHGKVVSRSTVVPASAADIFDVLADARRHREFDGSGTVRDAFVDAPERLALGSKFGMKMRIVVPYSMTNTVVEFEENKRIAWRHFGGHIWRYVLTPVEGGTLVTEQFDYATNRSRLFLKLMKAIENNERSMERTLANLERHFSPAS